jgi:hypothetical protein
MAAPTPDARMAIKPAKRRRLAFGAMPAFAMPLEGVIVAALLMCVIFGVKTRVSAVIA